MHRSFFFHDQRCTFSDFIAPGLTPTSKDSIYSVTGQVEGYTALPFAAVWLWTVGPQILARLSQRIPSEKQLRVSLSEDVTGLCLGCPEHCTFQPLVPYHGGWLRALVFCPVSVSSSALWLRASDVTSRGLSFLLCTLGVY